MNLAYLTAGFHIEVLCHQQIISAVNSQSIQILQFFKTNKQLSPPV